MLSPWHWLNSVCRQKRILIVLCTFGSSFLLLNYTLLSSSGYHSSVSSTTTVDIQVPNQSKRDDDKVAMGRSKPQPFHELVIQARKLEWVDLSKDQKFTAGESDKIEEKEKNKDEKQKEIFILKHNISQEEKGGNVILPSAITTSRTDSTDLTHVNNGRNIETHEKTEENHEMIAFESSTTLGTSIMTSTTSISTITELFQSNKGVSVMASSTPSYSKPDISSGSGTPIHSSHLGNNKNDFAFSVNANLLSPFDIPPCHTPTQLRRVQKRKKNLTVIENFIMGWNRVKCNETITYTTHADYRYLDNLAPLAERWDGPVSCAIYAPGTDLEETLRIISYLKLCTSPKIDEWVTFHLIYDIKFARRQTQQQGQKTGDIFWLDELYKNGKWRNCSVKPTFSKGDYTFRNKNSLLYPINIARNLARSAANSYFVLASDIELYPSINLIPSFMKMLSKLRREDEDRISGYEKMKNKFTAAAAAVVSTIFRNTVVAINDEKKEVNEVQEEKNGSPLFPSTPSLSAQRSLTDLQQQIQRHVFVLPVFEVKKEVIPCQVETKEQLAALLKTGNAVLFHHSICPQCHTFPKFEEWKTQNSRVRSQNKEENSSSIYCNGTNNTNKKMPMSIFHKAKRKHPFGLWEPIFIGTKDDPIYDERLSYEGLRDKMVSGYIMCALDYDFYVLDNAFLVHKPGIRRVVHHVTKTVQNQDRLINYRIRAELLRKFGKHDECVL